MKVSLIIFFLFLFNSIFAQATWEKQYPRTSDVLHDVYAFDANTAIACGSNGEIWKTTDGGTTWSSIISPTTNELRDIDFSGTEGWIVGNFVILHSTDSGDSWTIQYQPSKIVTGVDFISTSLGWASASDGVIYKTTNGGSTWNTISTGSTKWFTAIDFYNSKKGWVVGWDATYGYTTDGGANWTIFEGASGLPILLGIQFIDENIGFRVGEKIIQRSSDGGVTWADTNNTWSLPSGGSILTKTVHSITWSSNNVGYIAATDGKVIKTLDNGISWTEQSLGDGIDLYSISAPRTPNSTAWTVGNMGVIYKTTNGTSWSSQVKQNTSYELSSVFYVNQNTGWATTISSDGTLLKTTNGGEDWTILNLNTTFRLNDLTFPSANIGYVVGDNDKVFYTSDSGNTWLERNVTGGGNLTCVDFSNDNIGFIGADGNGGQGYLFKTINRGKNWVRTNIGIPIYDIEVINASTVIAVGYGGNIYKSADLGDNWSNKCPSYLHGDNGDRLYGVAFPTSLVGYACGSNGIIIKTNDAGETWTKQNTGGFDTFNDIFFIDVNHGWMVGEGGAIYYTDNGGTTWIMDDSKTSKELNSLFFPAGDNGWAVGKDGTVVKATTDPVLRKPGIAQPVYPMDKDVDVDVIWDLGWDAGSGGIPTGYKLYFGTDGNGTTTPTNIVNGSDLGNVKIYNPQNNFTLNTTYYWQIVPYNSHGSTSNCPIWSFTTRKNNNYGGGSTRCPGLFFANSLPGAIGAPSQPMFNWIDPLANNHTIINNQNNWNIGNDDNGFKGPLAIGFSFPFFGTNYTSLYIGSNGVITFDAGYSGPGTNASIPSTDAPNNMIAALLMDLESDQSDPLSGVYYESSSTQFVVTWMYYHPKGEADYISFQIIIKPSGYIVFQYNDAESTVPLPNSIDSDALIGIEDATGTMGLLYRNNGVGGPIFGNAVQPPSPIANSKYHKGRVIALDSENAVAFGEDKNNLTPVRLKSFSGKRMNKFIILNWETATEVNNYGFAVERKSEVENREWQDIGFIEGHGNSNTPNSYSFIDNDELRGVVSYRLKQLDFDGGFEYSDIIELETSSNLRYKLEQNSPNPFNPSTNISFTIPNSGLVKLCVYNVLGELVTELVNDDLEAGSYQYQLNASNLSSGIYFYSISVNNFREVKKMNLIK